MKQILEGSRVVALTIKNIRPDVISAYPITPQTHIVEDLSKFKANGEADYEFVRAESEFAAASIVAGASATGVRTYTATSSQGLLLMAEVLYNIAGMRLPIVLTCANRALSAPINIWNDQQDAVTLRDSGWILLFAENHQESVDQHVVAFKLAEKLKLPVMVNIDGYILTHSYESVEIPDNITIKKYLPDYTPTPGQYLDVNNPASLGGVAFPTHYFEIREELDKDLKASLTVINKEYSAWKKIFKPKTKKIGRYKSLIDNGLIEYYGPNKPQTILVAMGSVVGTIKDVIDENKNVGVLKIKCLRPFPADEINKIIGKAKYIAVLDKSISLGHLGPLAADIRSGAYGKIKTKITSFVLGLGGRDITKAMIAKVIKEVKTTKDDIKFIGKA